ncbi:MAG TPA: DUF5054 domain-containing protein [Candidatus Lumbricidophila sp.]|nr:DUF5054 domain-containing protein [Candidatus Lumbricidophila sp.]
MIEQQRGIRTVHVVFKTHLDIGFTDYAANVMENYRTQFIPKAIALADELERRGGPARFIWTTGSLLIAEALRNGNPAEREAIDQAIRAGHLTWHGLACTTHTELMDVVLAEHNLSIGAALDVQYGRDTIATKMTDVPGHTVGLVPVLAAAGKRYLHIGVNGSSAVPEVPEFSRWTAPTGEQVLLHYSQDYGSDGWQASAPERSSDALYIEFTNDNHGPPSAERIEEVFVGIQARYPDATVIASTLDAYARAILPYIDDLPVVAAEIGDSWIHGIATDPLLVAQYRALLRLRDRWVADGVFAPGAAQWQGFHDALLYVPEHTWGEDEKTFLPDWVNYEKPDFAAARAHDVIDPSAAALSLPELVKDFGTREPAQGWSYSAYERSWQEQRDYIARAIAALEPDRRVEAEAAIAECGAVPAPTQGAVLDSTLEHQLGRFVVRFGEDGSITQLRDATGHDWASPGHTLGAYCYQSFDEASFDRWYGEYTRNRERNGWWGIPDFTKPGLSVHGELPATTFRPTVLGAVLTAGDDADVVSMLLTLPPLASEQLGAPRGIRLTISFPHQVGEPIGFDLALTGKDASRLPEAQWLGFRPRVADGGTWTLGKLGSRIDPTNVVRNGNRTLHAVTDATYTSELTPVRLGLLDAALLAPGEMKLLRYENLVADPSSGLHVNLQNNVWGTNFTMWFSDDVRFRFELSLG